jgi:glycine cleavage system T protein
LTDRWIGRTPLFEVQSARSARFTEFCGWEVAEHFGDARGEYHAVRTSAALFDLSYIAKFQITGRDRVRYLNNILSNDIKKLQPGTGCQAIALSRQGRMESDLVCLAFPEESWILCLPAGRERLWAALHRYRVADKVDIEDHTGQSSLLSLQGPAARRMLERILGRPFSGDTPLAHEAVPQNSGLWVAVAMDRTGCGGFDLILPAADATALWNDLVSSQGVQPAGQTCLNWLRTEAGIPWYGIDMNETSIPMAFGLEAAVSLSKGCYVGQEIVARITHRSHFEARFRGIAVQHPQPPPPNSEIRSAGTRIGAVTSSILSPALSKPLALAVIGETASHPGTKVEVMIENRAVPGEVVSLPLAGSGIHEKPVT